MIQVRSAEQVGAVKKRLAAKIILAKFKYQEETDPLIAKSEDERKKFFLDCLKTKPCRGHSILFQNDVLMETILSYNYQSGEYEFQIYLKDLIDRTNWVHWIATEGGHDCWKYKVEKIERGQKWNDRVRQSEINDSLLIPLAKDKFLKAVEEKSSKKFILEKFEDLAPKKVLRKPNKKKIHQPEIIDLELEDEEVQEKIVKRIKTEKELTLKKKVPVSVAEQRSVPQFLTDLQTMCSFLQKKSSWIERGVAISFLHGPKLYPIRRSVDRCSQINTQLIQSQIELLDMNAPYKKCKKYPNDGEIVVLDCEFAKFKHLYEDNYYHVDKVISTAIMNETGQIVFSRDLRPAGEVVQLNVELHGITIDDLMKAEYLDSYLRNKIGKFLDKKIIVGKSILNDLVGLKNSGIVFKPRDIIDIERFPTFLRDNGQATSLEQLIAEVWNLQTPVYHNAQIDTRATLFLFKLFKEQIEKVHHEVSIKADSISERFLNQFVETRQKSPPKSKK